MLDSRSYHGAKTGNLYGSDYVTIRTKIRIKLTILKGQHLSGFFSYLKLKVSEIVDAYRNRIIKTSQW